jgi:hypothetical protein
MVIISWVISPFIGIALMLAIALELLGLLSIPMAIIGTVRKRCPWYTFLLYLGIVVVCNLIFLGLLWLKHKVVTGDLLSGVLFWTPLIGILIGAFKYVPGFFKQIWQLTNSETGEKDSALCEVEEPKGLLKQPAVYMADLQPAAICPQCHSEYIAGVRECKHCGVPLVGFSNIEKGEDKNGK